MRILDKQEMHSQEQLSTLQNHLTQISKRFITFIIKYKITSFVTKITGNASNILGIREGEE